MGFWDVIVGQVHASGRASAGCGTDWESWSSDVRTLLGDAASGVLDGPIGEALTVRAGDLNQAAGRLVGDVTADGENIANAACAVDAGDHDATGSMAPALATIDAVVPGLTARL
jgi:hypothetical protein